MNCLQISVCEPDAGADVAGFLCARLIRESKTRIRRLVATGEVTVNGRAVSTSHRLKVGDLICLPGGVDAGPPPPSEMDVEVIYEDGEHLAVNKPAGWPVVPGRGGRDAEFFRALVALLNRDAPAGGPYVRPHVVHRLDRETTGVLLVAKDEPAGRALSMQFQHRQVQKTYLAVAEGVLPRAEVTVDAPVRRLGASEVRMVCDERGGKPASTRLHLKEAFGHFCLLEARPLTGRQHQIRLHMAALGYPLAADSLYGRRSILTGAEFNAILGRRALGEREVLIERCPLHALSLSYRLPGSGEPATQVAPVPADMERLLDLLRRLDPAR